LQVIDLGCGTGSSTRVLAFYCPAGSRIIGYEMVRPLIECARRRRYLHRTGETVNVTFICQPVTEPFRQADGSLVPPGSIDVASASGVVGHHLNGETVLPLVRQLQRTIAANGIAMLDVGPSLPMKTLVPVMARHDFTVVGRYKSWLLDPTGQVVFRRSV
jgi:SAM-dependent methyltransferase